MIIHDLNVVNSIILPDEAYPELIVDSYAALPMTIAFEVLQPVSGRNSEIA